MGVLKDDALQSAWHHGAVTSANPAEAAPIYGWISAAGSRQSGAAERRCIYLNKTPSSPPTRAPPLSSDTDVRAGPGEGAEAASSRCYRAPLATFHIQMSPCLSPRFALIYTINARVTRAQLLQTAYCRRASPGALFRGAVSCEAQTAAARQPPLL